MIEVILEDKDVILNFPDGMDKETMRQAINKKFYPQLLVPKAKEPGFIKAHIQDTVSNWMEGWNFIKTSTPQEVLNEMGKRPAGRIITEPYGLLENVPSFAVGVATFLASFPVAAGEAVSQMVGKGKIDFAEVQKARAEFFEGVESITPDFIQPQTEAGQKYQRDIAGIMQKWEDVKSLSGEQWGVWLCGGDKQCEANVSGFIDLFGDASLIVLPKFAKDIKQGNFRKILNKEDAVKVEKSVADILEEVKVEVRKRPKTPEELAKEVEVEKGVKEAEAELKPPEIVPEKIEPIKPETIPELVELGEIIKRTEKVVEELQPKPEVPKREVKEPTPKAEPIITKELKSRVDEAIGDVTPPVGLSIKTTTSQNLKSAREFKFESPEMETRWKSAQGIRRVSIVDRGKVALKELWHKMSRGVYEHLPRTKEFSLIRTKLLRLARQKGVATDKALRNIQGITIKFNKPDRNLFDRKIILEDLKQTVKEKKDVPFGFTEESVIAELSRINAEIGKHPEITKAVQLREGLWDAIRQDYSQAMKDIGFDVSDRLVNKSYYRHQILDYVQAKGVFGAGARLRTPTGRGFLKKRKGSELDINVDYIQAEHEVMSQMFYDIEVAKTIKLIKDSYDIAPQIKKQLAQEKLGDKALAKMGLDEVSDTVGKDWHDLIPEGYEAWQPREGNVFYMSDSVPAKLAEQLLEGKFTEIGVKASDLQKAVSLGKKRKEFVVKEEIAKTLDNLVRNKDRGRIMEIDRTLLRRWKQWQLISPRRFLKYNFRNLTGDADKAFLGNPSGFKKTPQAYKELYEVFYGDKSMSPELQAWFERGGMETTLQAQEMGQINKLRMFQKQYETKFKVKDVPIKIWYGYWRNARLLTDFREAILRYANYLDYLEQMNKHPQGLPKNYGASLREEIQGLSNKGDRAFKLSNELLGAYDDISVLGQALRDHIFPFWSWKEINMRGYYRIYKNAMRDGQLAQTTSRHLLKGIVTSPYKAYRIGKVLAKATAFWSAFQVWNHTFFPEEEAELGAEKRSRPHILFGRDKNGKIISFDRIGALGDFLEWFGLDAAPLYIDRWFKGKMTLKEIGTEMAKSPVNVVVQGLTPYFKTPAELLSQKVFFPDYSKPRTIRDNGLHIARSLGLGNEYKAIAGLPSEPYFESISGVIIYKTDPGQAAYSDIYEEKKRFLKKIGKGGEGFWLTPRGDALYNMKLALRYKDDKAAEEYFTEYLTLGGSIDGLKTSLRNMNPLSGLTQIERITFMSQLNEEDKRNLTKALIFYDEVLLGNKPKKE